MKGNLSLGNKYINNLATPITSLQAVNKTYCDSAIATAASVIMFRGSFFAAARPAACRGAGPGLHRRPRQPP